MDPIRLALARGKALMILLSQLNLNQEHGEDSLNRYMLEGILLNWLARRGFPMQSGELTGSVMTYLKDRGYVIYRKDQPAGPGTSVDLYWRITAEGQQILEGLRQDPGVRVL